MRIPPAHRRFVIVDQLIGPIVINFGLNAAIAWAAFRHLEHVPLWGQSSIAGDTVGTALMLPLLTSLIVSRVVSGQVAHGKLAPLEGASSSSLVEKLASKRPLVRGVALGSAAIALAALPVVAWLAARGPDELQFGSFVWFKAIFATLLGVVVTPLLGWVALVVASRDVATREVRLQRRAAHP